MKPPTQRASIVRSTHTNNFIEENSGGLSQPPSASTSHFSAWTLAPLRLFLGITFIYAGIQKLTDPQFFRPSAAGYIGKQIIAFAHGSPLHDFLINVASPHAILFGQLVAYGEIAIGLGALLGLLLRPAAFFGMLLSILFFLSASFHVYPYFYGADIVFAFCWLTLLLVGPLYTALPSIDGWLLRTFILDDITQIMQHMQHVRQPGMARRSISVLFGGDWAVQAATHPFSNEQFNQNQPPARKNVRSVIQRKQQTRRTFLAGVLTGGVAALSIAVVGFVLRSLGQSGDGGGDETANIPSTPPTPVEQGSTSATQPNGTAGASSSSGALAKISDVAKNSAVTFTIPSSGDPGVLIHLSNDQFVAYDATCTHAGCQVDYDSGSENLVCPCHGATFDPKHAAAVLDGPTSTPLTSVAIHVDASTGAITLQ
jgi:thiosulfate dehydrogenase [quinone] large subunit